ncbi:MAG: aminotransferase class I/II-fold pyridoxal phosphate-dependent enzyme, partial [Acidobacteriota bacterium]
GLIQLFLKVKLPYNLNAITQKTGVRALGNVREAVEQIEQIISERKRLESELAVMDGIEIVSYSQANFILFRCREATTVFEKLFKQGIVIRDRGTQYGLQNCLRVSVGTPEENDLFLAELRRSLYE